MKTKKEEQDLLKSIENFHPTQIDTEMTNTTVLEPEYNKKEVNKLKTKNKSRNETVEAAKSTKIGFEGAETEDNLNPL